MSEHTDQVTLFHWLDLISGEYPEVAYAYAIPNGAKLPWRRNKAGQRYSPQAIKLKAEGLLPGIPDLCIPSARGGWFGLFIELKYGKNKPTPEQVRVMAYLEQAGYKCAVCYGFEQARDVILDYLRQERTK